MPMSFGFVGWFVFFFNSKILDLYLQVNRSPKPKEYKILTPITDTQKKADRNFCHVFQAEHLKLAAYGVRMLTARVCVRVENSLYSEVLSCHC